MIKLNFSSRPKLLGSVFVCYLILQSYFCFVDKSSIANTYTTITGAPKTADPITISRRVFGEPTNLTSDTCVLPKLEPWDPEVRKRMKKPGPVVCTPTFKQLTSLENGTLRVNFTSDDYFWNPPTCYYRCHYPINDYKSKIDKWTELNHETGSRPGCDVVEVDCRRYLQSIYSFIHTQIVENPKITGAPHSDYNFYWVVIDSVSMSMFKRAMVETRKVLLEKFGAVEFPYLNKITNPTFILYGPVFSKSKSIVQIKRYKAIEHVRTFIYPDSHPRFVRTYSFILHA